jgi:hypothetical protein
MRDVAILALLFGIEKISKLFRFDEDIIMSWVRDLGNDDFCSKLRLHIGSQLRCNNKPDVPRKYKLSNSVVQKLVEYEGEVKSEFIKPDPFFFNDNPAHRSLVKSEEPDIFNIKVKAKVEETIPAVKPDPEIPIPAPVVIKTSVEDYIVEYWYVCSDSSVISTTTFISCLSASKPMKKYYPASQQPIPVSSTNASASLLSFSRNWARSFQSSGKLINRSRLIRPASSVLQAALSALSADSP